MVQLEFMGFTNQLSPTNLQELPPGNSPLDCDGGFHVEGEGQNPLTPHLDLAKPAKPLEPTQLFTWGCPSKKHEMIGKIDRGPL